MKDKRQLWISVAILAILVVVWLVSGDPTAPQDMLIAKSTATQQLSDPLFSASPAPSATTVKPKRTATPRPSATVSASESVKLTMKPTAAQTIKPTAQAKRTATRRPTATPIHAPPPETPTLTTAAARTPKPVATPRPTTKPTVAGVPQKAYDVLEYVLTHDGNAPPGYQGGVVFQNRERILPRSGRYREYDVNPKIAGQNRGAERLVIDADGSAWYTDDHYASFTQIR